MKGVILCAGKGTRLQPLTYTRPKCMVPVSGEPIIISIINKLVRMGITDIGIVINHSQTVIQELLGDGEQLNASLTFLHQREALGLADAVRSAYSFVGKEPFLLMLGDNLIEGPLEPLLESMIRDNAAASILLAYVDDPKSYGIATIANRTIVRLEEKPSYSKSHLGIVGAYVLNHQIWHAIEHLSPSARGEYELTDAIQKLIDSGNRVSYFITEDPFFDIGTHDRWLAANRYKMDLNANSRKEAQPDASADLQIIPPVIIDPSAKVFHSIIGPYVYIGPECVINHCKISNSIVTDNVRLSHVNADESVFGHRVQLSGGGSNRQPFRYIIGDRSSVDSLNSNENN